MPPTCAIPATLMPPPPSCSTMPLFSNATQLHPHRSLAVPLHDRLRTHGSRPAWVCLFLTWETSMSFARPRCASANATSHPTNPPPSTVTCFTDGLSCTSSRQQKQKQEQALIIRERGPWGCKQRQASTCTGLCGVGSGFRQHKMCYRTDRWSIGHQTGRTSHYNVNSSIRLPGHTS